MSDMPTQQIPQAPQAPQPAGYGPAPGGPTQEPPGDGDRGRGIPVWVFIVTVLAVAALAGAGVFLLRNGSASGEQGDTALEDRIAALEASASQAATTTPLPPPPPPPAQTGGSTTGDSGGSSSGGSSSGGSTSSGPKLGPSAPKSYAYLTDMYKQGGYWYVVVDFVQVGEGADGVFIKNENPKLRTYPLKSTTKLLRLESPGSTNTHVVSISQFHAYQEQSGKELVIVTPSGGYATRVEEAYMP